MILVITVHGVACHPTACLRSRGVAKWGGDDGAFFIPGPVLCGVVCPGGGGVFA